MSHDKTTRETELAEFAKSLKRFENHQISRRGEGRYLLQTRSSDDSGWDWIMAAEIHCSFNFSSIYVCGDIYPITFGFYSSDRDLPVELRERRLLNWMGKCRDIDYYVAQKATIGMGGSGVVDALVWEFDRDLAEKELRSWYTDRVLRLTRDGEDVDSDDTCTALSRILAHGVDDSKDVLVRQLWDTCNHDFLYSHMGNDSLGLVLSWRVKIAHAAIAKLCQLLDAEDAAAVGTTAGVTP